MSIEFSALHFIINDDFPSIALLNSEFNKSEDTFQVNDDYYLISKAVIGEEYFWFYARYGKAMPYSPVVFNTVNETEEPNPRTADQVEPAKQLFGLYCPTKKILYFSSSKKTNVLTEYLKAKLSSDVVIKPFYKNPDEFISQIRGIDKIKFVVKRNLFNNSGEIMKIFPSPVDLYGLGIPESFSLEANFHNVNITNEFIDNFKKMIGWKNGCEADSLLCIGRDENGFETIFNVDSFIQKISVSATKDNEGMFIEHDVQAALISKLKGG